MKKPTFFLLIATIGFISSNYSQTWQWARTGGSTDNMGTNEIHRERVRSVATDLNNNVYMLASVGLYNLKVAGITKTSYNEFPGQTDIALAKFDCRGNYKWSRIIGGRNSEDMTRVFTDTLGNVYASGRAHRVTAQYPVKFGGEGLTETDTILPHDNVVHKRNLFLVKYDSIGNMKWLRMPQPENISFTEASSQSFGLDLHVEPNGNSHWYVRISPGTYADGAYTHSGTEPGLFILKYDAEGNFLGAVPLPVYMTGQAINEVKMTYDRILRRYYLTGTVNHFTPNEQVIFNGQAVTGSFFIAAFSENGNLIWWKQNTHIRWGTAMAKNVTVDNQGFIYLTGGSDNTDTFNGTAFPTASGDRFPFLLKLNPDGSTAWMTNANTNSYGAGHAVTINGDEVAITSGYGSMQWDNYSLLIQANSGYDAYVARFNKNTGAALGLHSLESSFGSTDFGNSITADQSGNYIIGGEFSYRIIVDGQAYLNPGQQTDFFVAKLGTSCDALSTDKVSLTPSLRAYPNPTTGIINLTLPIDGDYVLYNSLGVLIQQGTLHGDNKIDISGQPIGIYLLNLSTHEFSQTIKIVKD